MISAKFWKNRRVLITGHTGFKGSWLSTWLHSLGAVVTGVGLAPPFKPSLFELGRLDQLITSNFVDICDQESLTSIFRKAKPEIIIHMSAQSLVRKSYDNPVDTYRVNVLGTATVLDCARTVESLRAVVNVTSDKCYENVEWLWGYRESDPLGGSDPYSSSKAAAELVTQSFRRSFFPPSEYGKLHSVLLASVRAGNVIGGGDWSSDRLIPDILRSVAQNTAVIVRNPDAVRPWQHVLEPLCGYLMLAQKLFEGESFAADAWNFGPDPSEVRSVAWVIDRLKKLLPEIEVVDSRGEGPHEARFLRLDSTKARDLLHWTPVWNCGTAIEKTVNWFRAYQRGEDLVGVTMNQIQEYATASRDKIAISLD